MSLRAAQLLYGHRLVHALVHANAQLHACSTHRMLEHGLKNMLETWASFHPHMPEAGAGLHVDMPACLQAKSTGRLTTPLMQAPRPSFSNSAKAGDKGDTSSPGRIRGDRITSEW
eukprot:1136435-Pelagomonas_calceolata.AAC.5